MKWRSMIVGSLLMINSGSHASVYLKGQIVSLRNESVLLKVQEGWCLSLPAHQLKDSMVQNRAPAKAEVDYFEIGDMLTSGQSWAKQDKIRECK